METSNAPERGKKIWIRALVGFFAVMALLTFFSATLRNSSLARVTIATPLAAALQKVVSANGTFEPVNSMSVDTDIICRVASVSVAAGETVKAGDTLLTLDAKALSDILKQEQDALAKLKNNRKKTANSYMPEDLTQFQVSLDIACRKLEDAQKNVNYVQGNVSSGTAEPSQLDEAKQAVEDAQNEVTIKTGQLADAREQNSRQSESNKLDIANMDIDIAAQQEKVDELQSFVDSGGKIPSSTGGIVSQVNVQAGENTDPAKPLILVTDISEGMKFKADITKEEAALIPAEAVMDIHLAGVSQRIPAKLREKKESEDSPGKMTTLVLEIAAPDIGDMGVQPGQAGDIRYTQTTENYDMTVPNGAVREDSTGDFVLVAEEKDTPLGKQQVLRRVGVMVDDSDAFGSAVTGALSLRDKVVCDSDKPVAEGDTVLIGS